MFASDRQKVVYAGCRGSPLCDPRRLMTCSPVTVMSWSLRSGVLAAEQRSGRLAGCEPEAGRQWASSVGVLQREGGGAATAKVTSERQALRARHRRPRPDPPGRTHTFHLRPVFHGFVGGLGLAIGAFFLGFPIDGLFTPGFYKGSSAWGT